MKALTTSLLFLSFAAAATEPAKGARQVELILDASGSMNAKTADGTPRIDAAKSAVKSLASAIPPDTQVALRAYGHRSAKEKKDCDDIELLTPFAPAKDAAAEIVADSGALSAKGYTPIQRSLKLAAADFPKDGAAHAIVLVSDGKETCDADPCAEAKRLVAADKNLVIHTVGFDVDEATRTQLSCIARVSGGKYFEAKDAGGLASVLGEAAVAPKSAGKPVPKGQGTLAVTHPDAAGHEVLDAAGKKVGRIDPGNGKIPLPAGDYSVSFGGARWSGVEVKPGQVTTLTAGVLELDGAALQHKVTESETGAVFGTMNPGKNACTLLPGVYDVSFGKTLWKDVRVEAGKTTRLLPAVLELGKTATAGKIFDVAGNVVESLNAGQRKVPVPPGDYTVKVDGKDVSVSVKSGEKRILP